MSVTQKMIDGRRFIDYDEFVGEMREHTYHAMSPLAATHGSCAKMFYLVMDVLVGKKTWEEIHPEFQQCREANRSIPSPTRPG